jgi:hypothetical protein
VDCKKRSGRNGRESFKQCGDEILSSKKKLGDLSLYKELTFRGYLTAGVKKRVCKGSAKFSIFQQAEAS